MVTRKELCTIPAQSLPINAVAFSPDGKVLATGSGDWRTESPGEVELWDPDTGHRIGNAWHSPRESKALAFSPDGVRLAVAHAASRVPGGDGGVTIQRTPSPSKTDAILRCPTGATAVAFSPDGKIVAAGQWSGELRLWDTAA